MRYLFCFVTVVVVGCSEHEKLKLNLRAEINGRVIDAVAVGRDGSDVAVEQAAAVLNGQTLDRYHSDRYDTEPLYLLTEYAQKMGMVHDLEATQWNRLRNLSFMKVRDNPMTEKAESDPSERPNVPCISLVDRDLNREEIAELIHLLVGGFNLQPPEEPK